ncbi:MAG TPA: amino acid adenylation domain-containing protein, partial [Thermoanaerobaculia bacterium]|nr:amino acid adenylation domain-containing protein [Thermoanaerobaculia bacterium]
RRPLSHGQRALWLLDRMVTGGNAAYVLGGAARVRGELDAARLRRALQTLVERHPALRTTFEADGEQGVRVVRAAGSFVWTEEDAAGWSEARLAERLVDEAERPFDLAAGPLLRVALFRRADEHLVVLAVHHIVADFWSLGVLVGELGALYRGEELAPPAGSYEELLQRQERLLAGPEGERLAGFWRSALPPGMPVLELPADRPRPPLPSFRGGARRLRLDHAVTAGLQALGRRSGATPFMTLLAAFLVLLHRHGGQERLLVGTPAAGRGAAGGAGLSGLAGVVGYCVNPVVVQGDLSGEPDFAELLARVRDSALAAFAHQDYPFALLAERQGGERDASRSPIFQAMFALYRERHERERGLGGFALGEAGARIVLGGARGPVLESVRLDRRSAQFDVSLLVAELGSGLAGTLQFDGDLFDGATAERMLGHLGTMAAFLARADDCHAGARGPSIRELPLLGAGERQQLLVEWNDEQRVPRPATAAADTAVARRAGRVHELFEWQAARRPQAPAVTGQGVTLSYGELEARANRLARYLRRLGVGAEARVGLCVERTPEMVVALLAILKAGGAYVPLDPGHPAERLALVLGDSAPAVLVTEERWLERLGGEGGPAGGGNGADGAHGANGADGTDGSGAGRALVVCLDREREWIAAEDGAALEDAAFAGGPETLAYVIYTSGSTGRPKGVGLPHRAVVNFLRAMAERPGLGAGDVVPALTTLTFDIAGLEIYLPLAVGGRVEVVGSEEGADGGRLAARLAAAGVTAMQATPATWRLLLDAGWAGPPAASAGEGRRQERAGRACAAPRRFKALCGGEALPWELAAALLARGVELWNVYGPTETAVWSAVRRVAEPVAASGVVGLGRPIAESRFHVVDPGLLPVPMGAAGELVIGGEGLARGYWGRPELTAERFVPDPWSGRDPAGDGRPAAGRRLYRTGDLVRHRPDGDLEFLGRIDHQVKVRGFRIELGEIESALRRHPAVGQAVVTARGEGTDRRLVAYLVPRTGGAAPAAELRQWLRRRLPEYMVPADFVALERLPLSPAGKVDRRALPAPPAAGAEAAGGDGARIAPRTPTEELLAGMWAELLGLGGGQVGVGDDFFRLGGHSLLAVRVAARLRELLGVELSLPRLLQLSRLEDLAREVEELGRGGRPRPAPLRRLPREPGKALASAPSFAQERLWFLEQLEPGGAVYNEPRALRLRGQLDVAALAGSIGEIRRRHEVLRTRFAARGGAVVAVADVEVAAERELPVVDLGALPEARRPALAESLVAAEARRPFDLAAGPLLRTALLRLTPAGGRRRRREPLEHVLLLTTHHVVSDGWSLEVLARELSAGYAARAGAGAGDGAAGVGAPQMTTAEAESQGAGTSHGSTLPALPIQYADFAHWQRELLSGETLAAELAFWRERLAGPRGLPPQLELPLDRPRPLAPSSRGARRTLALPAALAGELAALGQRHGATLFMTLLAAFDALLARYSGQSDVAVGTVVANRGRLETENLIGLFVNTLVMRVDLAGDPDAGELLGRVRQAALGAYAHQDVPFDKLVGELGAARGLAANPFFQTVLAIHAAPPPPALPGVAVEVLEPYSGTAKFDLSLAVAKTPAGELAASWTWRTELFDAATVERLASHWRNLLAGMAAAGAGGPAAARRLSSLPLLAAAERHQLLVEWNGTPWEAGDDDMVQTPFERQAARDPAAVALVAGQAAAPGSRGVPTLTYGELEMRANGLARTLRGMGVGPEQVVGICAEPSCALVVGLLGILKAGGAYLPLDPAHPEERLAQLLADAGARVALAEERTAERLPPGVSRVLIDGIDPTGAADPTGGIDGAGGIDGEGGIAGAAGGTGTAPRQPRPVGATPGNAAYILYTSGSTGTPKGVVVPHRAVANRLRYQVATDLAPGARVLQRTRLGFDVSVLEIFAPLWMGATVVLPEAGRQQDAPYLARLIAEQRVTNVNVPPVFFPALLAEESFRGCGSLRRVVTGGDRVPGDLPGRYFAAMGGAAPDLFSRYGPTETTVSMADWHCRDEPYGPSVPIGRPLAGARVYLLDRGRREVPPGMPGELCIGGPCLARGYLGRPELTAAAFIPDPFARQPEEAGERLYRTGDLARWRPGGVIEFLGRIDRQVKIRGIRLELGEVEAALARHPEVAEVAVIDREEPVTGGKRLVAYVVPRASAGGAGDDGDDGGGRAEGVVPGAAPGLDARRLRAFLAGRLPAAMVPAAFVLLPRLPLLPNLKLDRAALPAPESLAGAGEAGAGGWQAPRDPLEEALAGLWARLLGRERVGIDQDFFELGGHSLLATQLVSRVRETLAVELAVRDVFAAPTVAGLAERVAAVRAQAGPAAGALPPLLASPALPLPPAAGEPLPAEPPPGAEQPALAYTQERIWFLEQLAPGSAAYNIAGALRLSGPLRRGVLARSLDEIVRRHEVLRSAYPVVVGRPLPVVLPPQALPLPLLDLGGLGARGAAAASRLGAVFGGVPFDLSAGPLLRALLLRLGPAEHVLVLVMHHIVADGWSATVLRRELAALYDAFVRGAASPLAELPIQYFDFARWQRGWLTGERLEAELAWWQRA